MSSSESPKSPRNLTPSDIVRTMDIPTIKSDQINRINGIRLGSGTYGTVEKCQFLDDTTGNWINVAVKFQYDQADRIIIREAKVMRSLNHPHCVKLYGLYYSPRGIGVVMEYMDCKSVAELLTNMTISYTIDHFVSWMSQLADAVNHFHTHNELHRDLKLQNLLLCNRYLTLKVCDFGTFTPHRDSMQSMKGTPITMAPEIFRVEKYSAKCDIYSIGIIMWQLLARGDPYPVTNANAFALLYNVANGTRPPELKCDPLLSRFYKKCWHENPKVRPDSEEVVKYFSILKKAYPKGDEPLLHVTTKEPARTPQPQHSSVAPNLRAGHRRAGSDQSTLIQVRDGGDALGGSAQTDATHLPVTGGGERNARSHSVAGIIPRVRANVVTNILDSVEDTLRPIQPVKNSERSQQLYDDHLAELHELKQLREERRQGYAKKHALVVAIQRMEEIQRLKDEQKKKLETRDRALKKIQQLT